MNDKILDYISRVLSNEQLEEELQTEDDLLGGGVLDSLGMMKLILFIEEEFKVKVPPEDMTIENFMTVDHIVEYLNKK